MKRLISAAALFLCTLATVSAFPYTVKLVDDYEEEQDDDYTANPIYDIQHGDQYIRISLGVVAPLNFPDVESLFHEDKHQLYIGGMGTLGYHYFLNHYLALGFDVGFGFNVTIGSHIFNYVPIMFSATYQPTWHRLEFPLTLNVGFAWEAYNNKNYFPGLVVKPEAGIHFRINENWSIGSELSWMILPQFSGWYNEGESYTGHFLTLAIAARYYF